MNDKSGLPNDMRHANGGKIVRLIDVKTFCCCMIDKFVKEAVRAAQEYDHAINLAISMAKNPQMCLPVDAESVRHGRWKYDTNANDWGIGGYVCSECGAKNNNLPCNKVANLMMFVGSNYCPHCGAKMDLEEFK